MLRWRILVAVAAGLAVCAGCRTKPLVNAHLESVNAEYRELEDYVYALEDENDRLQRELAHLRNDPAAQRSSAPGNQPGRLFRRPDRSVPREVTPGESMPELAPPRIESGTPVDSSELDVPTIHLPTSPADTPPADTPPRESGKLRLAPPAAELPAPAGDSALSPRATPAPLEQPPTDRRVTHLFLNPALTGGSDFDGQPGDDGLLVVLEPRNEANQYIPAAGSVSVVVLDPNRVGDAARIARWDFDAAELADKFDHGTTRGLNLTLPWPATPPPCEKLHLFVRYVAPDGRKLQSDREIFLRRGEDVARAWTPRAAEARAVSAAEPVRSAGVAVAGDLAPLVNETPAAQSLPAGPVERTVLPPTWSPHR